MTLTVFISDLHLHPKDSKITKRFDYFIDWAIEHSSDVYILGDFFHVWPGDDGIDEWSMMIANQLARLHAAGIPVYFMPGNRDFLLRQRFLNIAKMQSLVDPCVINLGGERILLSHGDRYCTEDKSHQWLRRLTRNSIFPKVFLKLPYSIRNKLVQQVRMYSQASRQKDKAAMDTTLTAIINHMRKMGVKTLIHGHTHKPKIELHSVNNINYKQIILSDWDQTTLILCYNSTKGFYFESLKGE